MTTPKRPVVGPTTVEGTSLRRTYVAPGAAERAQLGDIVLHDGRQWDVVGSHALAPPDETGIAPVTLMLERRGRPIAGKKQVIRVHARARDCAVLARQILLPGTPTPAPPRDRDTG